MTNVRSELTHDWIWRAVDNLASRKGLSPSGLARLAGLDPTAFNRSKRFTPEGRPRWPSTESVAKILEVTGTSLAEFADARACDGAAEEQGTLTLGRIPVVGEIRDAAVTGLAAFGEPADPAAILRPQVLQFALAVADNSLEPVYSTGNTLILSASETARVGDRVVVKPVGEQPVPRILFRQSRARIELATFAAADRRRRLGRDRIDWMARIIWVRQ